MNTQERGKLIDKIIGELRIAAEQNRKFFDAGDTFFSLAFKSDDELRTIAKLAGVL